MAKSDRTFEDKQAEVSDLLAIAKEITKALEQAESCETEADFNENLREAAATTRQLADEIKLLKQ